MITGQVPDKYSYLNFLWSGVGISTSESVGFGMDDFWGDELSRVWAGRLLGG